MFEGGAGSIVLIDNVMISLCWLTEFTPLCNTHFGSGSLLRPGHVMPGIYDTYCPSMLTEVEEYCDGGRRGTIVFILHSDDHWQDCNDNTFCNECCIAVSGFREHNLYFIKTQIDHKVHAYREDDIKIISFYNKVCNPIWHGRLSTYRLCEHHTFVEMHANALCMRSNLRKRTILKSQHNETTLLVNC